MELYYPASQDFKLTPLFFDNSLEEWDWPRAGVPTGAIWTLNKWRLALDDDLPTLCFLEIIGMRWQEVFGLRFASGRRALLRRLRRMRENNVSAATTGEMLRLYNQIIRPGPSREHDIWADATTTERANGQSSGYHRRSITLIPDST